MIPARITGKLRFFAQHLGYRKARVEGLLLRVPTVRLWASAIQGFISHEGGHLAAGIAYYAVMSIFPLILGLLALMGLILKSQELQQRLFDVASPYLPGSIDIVKSNVASIVRLRGTLGVVSILMLIWSTSAVFASISRALNRAWNTRDTRPFYIQKLFHISMALGVSLLVLSSIAATTVFELLARFELLSENPVVQLLDHPALSFLSRIPPFLITFLGFLLMYRFIPQAEVSLKDVWVGALVAATLFEMAKTLFLFYLANVANYQAVYGSLAAFIVLLVWLYVSAMILILGAEIASKSSLPQNGGPNSSN